MHINWIVIGILVAIVLLVLIVCILRYRRHKRAKCLVKKRCDQEKMRDINQALEPFGFAYHFRKDIFYSLEDSWQREFGYGKIYDEMAPTMNMMIDSEPIYFDYGGRHWMIEFWKGQYGVNLGCETGIYHADTVLSPEQYGHTLFHSVPDSQMLPMSMSLYHKGSLMFQTSQKHWWLTGFQTGKFCEPENLTMCVSITFPNAEMLQAFVGGLLHTGYQICDLNICDLTVTFTFCLTHTKQPCKCKCLLIAYVQWKNRLFCRLFQWVTRCFTCMLDKILYLYFFLPVFCRRMLRLKRNRKQKFRRKDRRRHEL